MTSIQALVLGAVQGVAEFLPVSSSGHLVFFQKLFGLYQPPILFDILVHLATLIAVIIFFWQSITSLKFNNLFTIVIANIPTALIGFYLNSIKATLFDSFLIISFGFLATSFFLISTKKITKTSSVNQHPSLLHALIIGLAQGVAIIPGISRAGATIAAGLWLGLKPKHAFNFSFLISIPAIIGAQLLTLKDLSNQPDISLTAIIIGFSTAAFTGYFSLKILKNILAKKKLHYFAGYTLALAIVTGLLAVLFTK